MDTIAVAIALGAQNKANAAAAIGAAIPGPAIGELYPAKVFPATGTMLSATSMLVTVTLTEAKTEVDGSQAAFRDLQEEMQKALANTGEARLVVNVAPITGVFNYGFTFPLKTLLSGNNLSSYSYFGLVSARFAVDATSMGLGIIDKEVLLKFYNQTNGGDVVHVLGDDNKYHAELPITISLV